MMFTAGGGKKAVVKKADGALPSKGAAAVSRGGGKRPAPRGKSDLTGMEDNHMDEALTDGGNGPAVGGKGFGGKLSTSAMSQVLRKKGGGGGLY